ncbi:MAG: helix-turn-helix domain-containing protein, partial [Dehalococcoidia bacterium]
MSKAVASVDETWGTSGYQRIAGATYDAGVETLVVRFDDGSCACIDINRIVLTDAHGVDWSQLVVHPYELAVPAVSGQIELSWSTLRALSDAAYAAHLANAAKTEAKQIGHRLRALRQQQSLGVEAAAARAGLSRDAVERAEQGQYDLSFVELRQLLGTYGCELRDLAEDIGTLDHAHESARRQ